MKTDDLFARLRCVKAEFSQYSKEAAAIQEAIVLLSERLSGVPQGWQPIETAPKEGDFLVYMPDEPKKVQAAWKTKDDK